MSFNTIPSKQCSCCKQFFPVEVFNFANKSQDKRHIYCKKCEAIKKGRVWRPECLIPDDMRECGHCRKLLPKTVEYFGQNKNCKGGWNNICKECKALVDSKYLDDNRERLNAVSKARYYAKPEARKKYNEEHKDQIAATKKRVRKANPELAKKHKRDSAKRHPESARRRLKKYNENHPEIARMRGRVSAMKRRVKVGNFKRSDLMDLYHEQNERCAYCGISIYWNIKHDIHVDHIQPVIKGGTNDLSNLALTCADCNLSKHDLPLDEWMQTRGW